MHKFLLLLLYPAILIICAFLIYKKYSSTILNNFKYLIINTVLISTLIIAGLYIFLCFENTIYTYDYAGHWIRSLEIKNLFINSPNQILPLIYESMNHYDYSYLPALFNFPFLLIKEGYNWFSISNYILFLLPTIILLQILYFENTNLNKYLPILLAIVLYPLYLTLFYGKVDVCGLFFIAMCYALVVLKDDITIIDNLSINLFTFLTIFLRRWYLYSVLCFYLVYLIKLLIKKEKKLLSNYLLSISIVGIIVLIFFKDFITMSISYNYVEAYNFYNRDNKILSFINYLSPIILIIVALGIYSEFKKNKQLLIYNVISIVIPCVLVWRIQSFEYHHYYIFLLNILILFISGLSSAIQFNKYTIVPIGILLTAQVILVFSFTNHIPCFTNIRKTPEVLDNKKQLIDLSNYLKSIEPDNNTTAFIAGGSYGIITDDLIRNANLPNLDIPNIDSSVFDIRDGFPKDMQFIKFIILIKPSLYMDKDYQHMYDVISEAITSNDDIAKKYNLIKEMPINNEYKALIYERTGEFAQETKQYFYDEMIKYYPDKKEFFKYILN